MKMKLNVLLLMSTVGLAARIPAFALSTDSLEVQEKIVLFQDAAKSKQYAEAATYLHWLLKNKPKQHVSIFIQGADVMDEMARAEKSTDKKNKFVDSLLLIYDLRLQYCGDSANVINRKALASYRYNINGPDPGPLLQLMDKAFALNGDGIQDGTLVPYMQAIAVNKVKKKDITQDEILKRYDKLITIIEVKIKAAANDKKRLDKLVGYKSEIDELLLKVVKVDCEFVHNNIAPKFQKDPANLTLAKQIFGYLLNSDCAKDSLWLKTGELIFSKEQTFGLAKHLGIQYLFNEDFDKAHFYIDESLKYAPTASDSADIYMFLGSLKLRKNDRINARAAYWNAARADPKHKEAYEKIGDLYYNSFNECAKEKSVADDRSTYLVAYDYYAKAGNVDKMAMAKKSFPSREEIFLMNYQTGQTIHVDCWIDESTIIRTRD